ncbi:MAG: hypothetical protein Q7T53_12870 [Deltaproteobacteria bacterium]|nr:hypothetical protein [Deltaproteobacteria bacterium]
MSSFWVLLYKRLAIDCLDFTAISADIAFLSGFAVLMTVIAIATFKRTL